MSINIPKSALGVCFMRGESIRGVGAQLYCATVQVEAGKIKDAQLSLGLARMNLETLVQISRPKDAKKAEALRKLVVKTSRAIAGTKTRSPNKVAFIEALAGDVRKLARSLSRSCRYYP